MMGWLIVPINKLGIHMAMILHVSCWAKFDSF